MTEAPSTKLEAVNVALTNLGEAPIDSLEGDLPLDAFKALGVLTEVSRVVQARGWTWNKEIVTLSPNETGKIPVPANALEVQPYERLSYKITVRDGLLYRIKRSDNGNVFTGPIEVEITYFLPYEDLSETAKRYISMRAARIFQARELGDQVLLQNDTTEEQIAWSDLRAEDNENNRRTLRNSYSVQMVTDRNSPVKIGY